MVKAVLWKASFGRHEGTRVDLGGSPLVPWNSIIIADIHEALAACPLCGGLSRHYCA